MRPFILLLILAFSTPSFFSCSGNTSSVSKGNADVAAQTSSPASDNASFSYVIEGRDISGSGTGNGANIARHTADGRLRFVLMSLDVKQKAPPQFDFAVLDHGSTTITAEDMDRHRSGDGKIFADFSIPPRETTDKIPDYEFANHITVTIKSLGGGRVTGSFSGDLLNPLSKKTVALENGIFDLPVSNSK